MLYVSEAKVMLVGPGSAAVSIAVIWILVGAGISTERVVPPSTTSEYATEVVGTDSMVLSVA